MKLTLDNPPEGYEARAEYRYPLPHEIYITSGTGEVTRAIGRPTRKHIVLTPKKPAYIPFTHETFSNYKGMWFAHKSTADQHQRILAYNILGVLMVSGRTTDNKNSILLWEWHELLEYFDMIVDVTKNHRKPAGIEQ